MNKTDGGPAFPSDHGELSGHADGMSLRDYFAAAAMTGLWTDPASKELSSSDIAQVCYYMADAMLAERAKQKEPDHGPT